MAYNVTALVSSSECAIDDIIKKGKRDRYIIRRGKGKIEIKIIKVDR